MENNNTIITINATPITLASLHTIENQEVRTFIEEWLAPSDEITLYTSGSTGTPKPFIASKRRMIASARMTLDFLRLKEGDTALLCMNAKYIAGKMMIVRSIVGGLNLLLGDVCKNPLLAENRNIDFAAMVPMQICECMKESPLKLRQIKKIIIGGGAIDADVEKSLSAFGNEIYATYGMTETLSHIAMRRINGETASPFFSPLKGISLSTSADHCLRISAPHLCPEELQTNDIVNLRPDGTFRILGRKDNVICSGGIKIQIEQAEDLIRPLVPYPFAVSSLPHREFGEIAVLVIEASTIPQSTATSLIETIKPVLPKYWSPKKIITINSIPRTETSKIARKALKDFLLTLPTSH